MRNNLFFISGRGRSGTWLLKSVLDAHPDLCVCPESIFVSLFRNKYINIKDWNSRVVKKFISELKKDQKLVDWWQLDFEQLESNLLQIKDLDYRTACLEVYKQYCLQNNNKYTGAIGDKNPEYSLRIDELLSVFPDSKFLILIRDPLDNIESYRKVEFDLNNSIQLAVRWNFYIDKILDSYEDFPNNIIIVKYEDLVLEPKTTLINICEFLDIEFDEEMMHFYKNPKNIFKWNSQITKPFNPDSVFKWKKRDLTINEKKASYLCKENIEKLGYSQRPMISTNAIDIVHIFKGNLVNWLEKLFFKLPLSIKLYILKFYRKKTKTF